jgi:hypothetical protein
MNKPKRIIWLYAEDHTGYPFITLAVKAAGVVQPGDEAEKYLLALALSLPQDLL